MPIPIPVTKTKIATVPWGIPITNEVNRLTTATTPSAWIAPTFLNGWVNFGSGQQVAQYRKVGDLVYLRGVVKSGTLGASAFNLPAGYRPPLDLAFAVSSAGAFGNIAVNATGDVIPANGNVVSFHFNGVCFSITP